MTTPISRLALALTCAVAIGALAAGTARAETARAEALPDRPIRFIVPFPAGGSTDAAARAVQPIMEKVLGHPVLVENRPGAGAVIGLDAVAKAAPDGTTIGIAPAGAMSVNPAMHVKMPFDVRKDFAPVSNLAETPFILAAPKSSPDNSLKDAIARAKAQPGALSIGHGGNGTSMYYAALLFTTMTQVQMGLVPYRGTVLVFNDLLGGHIPFGIVDPPPAQAALQDGRIKALAISSKQRFALFPDVPTFDEQGVTGYQVSGWFGIVAPAKTPPAIVAKLNAAVVTALKDPEVAKHIRTIGMEPAPTTPDEFGGLVDREIDKVSKVMAEAGAVAQ